MKTYEEWCRHYDHYDPASKEAKEDYARYVEQAKLIRKTFSTMSQETALETLSENISAKFEFLNEQQKIEGKK